jgi:succinyl-diaminopimelate desuccinylase
VIYQEIAMFDLLADLIAFPSITPDQTQCLEYIAKRLASCGTKATWLPYGQVNNLWLTHGTEGPLFVFLGHTDVVPPGAIDLWKHDPFSLTEDEGRLYGRGVADMKGSIASMIIAFENFIAKHPSYHGRFAMLLTADEEGVAVDGTKRVVQWLQEQKQTVDYCLVGEPTSNKKIADTCKIGRRGSYHATITIKGKQGHVAYPGKACNPIHEALPALQALAKIKWPKDEMFPETSLQIVRCNAGIGDNVIPGELNIRLNVRYAPNLTQKHIEDGVTRCINGQGLDYDITWIESAQPFYFEPSAFVQTVSETIKHHTGSKPTLSVSGGTSDARFAAKIAKQMLELGLKNESIHQVNEWTTLGDLNKLAMIYESILTNIFVDKMGNQSEKQFDADGVEFKSSYNIQESNSSVA